MLSTITRRKTLVKGHDPRNAATSIILSILITTFLLASAYLYAGVKDLPERMPPTEEHPGRNAVQKGPAHLNGGGATSTPNKEAPATQPPTKNPDVTKFELKDVSNRRVGYLLMSAVFLLASIPPVLAFVGIEKHNPRLLIPMIVLVYVFSITVPLGSAIGFAGLIFSNKLDIVTGIAVFLLGLGANLIFSFIVTINHCAFYHTYTFLKEPIRVSERVDIEETPIVSKFSQNL